MRVNINYAKTRRPPTPLGGSTSYRAGSLRRAGFGSVRFGSPHSGGSSSLQMGHCRRKRIQPSRQALWKIWRQGVTM